MRTWIVPVHFHTHKDGSQSVSFGEPFGVCGPGETDPAVLEYRKSVKTCLVLHGFQLAGWGGVIFQDYPVGGHMYRFFAQGGAAVTG